MLTKATKLAVRARAATRHWYARHLNQRARPNPTLCAKTLHFRYHAPPFPFRITNYALSIFLNVERTREAALRTRGVVRHTLQVAARTSSMRTAVGGARGLRTRMRTACCSTAGHTHAQGTR